jgi:endoglucanase
MNYQLLEKLIKTHSVTSHTSIIKSVLKKEFEEKEIDYFEDGFGTLAIGNIAADVMLTAHIDEVGFQVAKIQDNGDISILPVGNVHPNKLNHANVYVQTDKRKIRGAIFPSLELNENQIERYSDLFLDIGARSREEAIKLGIKSGQTGTFKKTFFRQNGTIFATGLDNKISIFSVLELLDRDRSILDKTFIAFHTDEEMQNHSANSLSVQFKPEFAVILDYFPVHQKPGDNDIFEDPGNGAILFYRGGHHILHEDIRRKLDEIDGISKGFVSSTTMQSLEPQNYENNGRTKAVNLGIPARGYHGAIYSVKEDDIEHFTESINKMIDKLLD